MGILKLLGRVVIYPVVRPAEQAKAAYDQINADLIALKRARAERAEAIARDHQAHLERTQAEGWEGYRPTAVELLQPQRIKDPYMRFEVMYSANNWNEEQLLEQLTAARITKRLAAYMSALMLLTGVISIFATWTQPAWVALTVVPLLFIGSVVGAVSAFRFGFFQAQIEQRKLFNHVEFWHRPGLLGYFFSK